MSGCEECFHYAVCDGDVGFGWAECPHFANVADVAPKEFTCVFGQPHKVSDCPISEEVEKARVEVAREIFEEIEKYNRPPLRECEPVYIIKAREFAELKKKYTEDTPDEKEQIVKALEEFTKNLTCPNFVNQALSIIREKEERIEALMLEYAGFEAGARAGARLVQSETVQKMQKRLTNRYEFNCNADEDNALYYEDLCEWVERIANELLEEDNQ